MNQPVNSPALLEASSWCAMKRRDIGRDSRKDLICLNNKIERKGGNRNIGGRVSCNHQKGKTKTKIQFLMKLAKKLKKKSEERRNVHQCFYTECCSTKLCQSLDVKSYKFFIIKEQKLKYH